MSEGQRKKFKNFVGSNRRALKEETAWLIWQVVNAFPVAAVSLR
jgi:hypothetical protein